MGGVFLRRDFAPTCEVINDYDREVANFFRVLQRHYVPFLDMLKWQLTSRSEFERLLKVNPETQTDLERAARFLYLQRTVFGRDEFAEMADRLRGLKGKFILSLNDCPQVRELFAEFDVEKVDVSYSLSKKIDARGQRGELLISN